MSHRPNSNRRVTPLSNWQDAEKYVKQWQTAPTEVNRELASKHVYGAMLRDTIGIVFKKVDNHRPVSLRRDRYEMADEIMQSIFAANRFTFMINAHQEDGAASLRTYLTRRIDWKLGDHLRRDKNDPLKQLDIPLDDSTLVPMDELQRAELKEEFAKDDQEIIEVWNMIDKILDEDKREKEVFVCHMDGFTNDEGAAACQLSLASYKRLKVEALRKLRIAYDQERSK